MSVMDNPRINIMRQNNREIAHFVELLGWNLNEIKCIERHDTLVYSVQEKNQQGETVTHRFALLYCIGIQLKKTTPPRTVRSGK